MKKILIQLFIVICMLALVFASACSKAEDTVEVVSDEPMDSSGTTETATETSDEIWSEPSVEAEEAMDVFVEAPAEAPAGEASEEMAIASDTEKTAGESTESDSEDSEGERQVVEPIAGQLTAGEWSDNSNFDFFLNLLNENKWYDMAQTWGYADFSRIAVNVFNDENDPIQNAQVVLRDDSQNTVYAARTDRNGIAYVFPYLFDNDIQSEFTLSVSYDGEAQTQRISQVQDNQTIDIVLDTEANRSDDVDVMFMIDTTGSMSDELSYIQTELVNVIETVQKDNQNELDIRVSVNFYRDSGDEYIIRPYDFNESMSSVIRQINRQEAAGGGDYEEAVEVALENAISEHAWNDEARARILFLVLDAPPHLNNNVLNTIKEQTLLATEKGIKIIPVASSGVDKNTEFLLRFLDVTTNGTYVFLTDHSGIGNSHIEPTIGMYDVEYLNNLLIRLINREVN